MIRVMRVKSACVQHMLLQVPSPTPPSQNKWNLGARLLEAQANSKLFAAQLALHRPGPPNECPEEHYTGAWRQPTAINHHCAPREFAPSWTNTTRMSTRTYCVRNTLFDQT